MRAWTTRPATNVIVLLGVALLAEGCPSNGTRGADPGGAPGGDGTATDAPVVQDVADTGADEVAERDVPVAEATAEVEAVEVVEHPDVPVEETTAEVEAVDAPPDTPADTPVDVESPPTCGDGTCNGTETPCTCPLDCGTACGARVCGDDGCGGSCGDCVDGTSCQGGACAVVCGDKQCGTGEDCATCPDDCGSCCGNGACDHGELCGTCAADCCSPTPGFVKVAAGSFWMGAPGGCPGPEGYPGDCTEEWPGGPYGYLHHVQLTHAFELEATEVPQGDWKALYAGWNPSSEKDCGDMCPVESISWFDTLAYADSRSAEAGLVPCYAFTQVTCQDGSTWYSDYGKCMNATRGGIKSATIALPDGVDSPYGCAGYRLPMEAEWEYAARAGTLSAYCDGGGFDPAHQGCEVPFHLTDIAWYCGDTGGDSPYTIMGVATKAPNAWGLFDMAGNVAEWCFDTYTIAGDSVDPVYFDQVNSIWKSYRGGSWAGSASGCRSADREETSQDRRSPGIGLRLARTL